MATLKILHVVEATFAGVGRHALDLVECQLAAGHDVQVLYSSRREDEPFRLRRQALPQVQWHHMNTGNMPAPGDLKSLLLISRICRTQRIDIVHGHSTKGGLLARLALAGRHASVVYTPNAFYSMNPMLSAVLRRAVGVLERLLAYRTDAVIAVSPEEQRHAFALGIAPGKVHVIPNGIPLTTLCDAYEAREALGLPHGVPVVGFVGRLDAQKSPLDLAAVFQRLATELPSLHFAVVGDGPLRDACENATAREPTTAERCHWLGRRDGFAAMAAFDVFLLPSRYEGFPYVLIEAAMNGLPIVTTREASSSAIVKEGVNGIACPAGDVDALADAVHRYLNDPALRASASLASKELAARFTLPTMCRDVASLYRQLIDAQPGRARAPAPESR